MRHAPVPAKASTIAETSDSIVVSFAAEWHRHLVAKDFTVVIRKRIPKNIAFKWLYFHINRPISALCGRAEIRAIGHVATEEAVGMSKKIGLQPAAIAAYIGRDRRIGCYTLGALQLAPNTIPTARLSSHLTYHPPQSFLILSKEAKTIVDGMLGFGNARAESSPKGPQP